MINFSKDIDILILLKKHLSLTLDDIATMMNTSRTSVHRILKNKEIKKNKVFLNLIEALRKDKNVMVQMLNNGIKGYNEEIKEKFQILLYLNNLDIDESED